MRFSKELEQLKKDVAKWQSTPDLLSKSSLGSPILSPELERANSMKHEGTDAGALAAEQVPNIGGSVGPATTDLEETMGGRKISLDKIPLLDENAKSPASGAHIAADETGLRERRSD
jgi:hypothetical protein